MEIITQRATLGDIERMAAGMFGNMRPSQENRSRGVESSQIRERIIQVVAKRIKR